ncbi:TonB-dependent receptor [Fulvivirgaceae bacterium BMA10]|uniref:TonB-dependent receptor n=1 Tax=Splendidivirga corallicola TaxID=3051826 RepID=A0ABT8KWN5_9BACT|nr:TonB-dependent receptor [Fulvivirgaceae bacterium BMA10]
MRKKLRTSCLLLFALLFSATVTFGQDRTITGKVTDGTDQSGLPGVNIVIKGTSIGSITDVDGNYSINVPSSGGILVFSSIGFLPQEIEIGSQSQINIVMSQDVQQLSEVVIVGYGTQLKQDLTGNIAKVSGEEIRNIPVNSFESAIQGRTSGVFIEKSSGKLGEGIKIRVRGSSSISASNQPLYVVDGIPVTSENQGITNNQPTNPLADINFNDVESIEVLKDASAAAIYGSRASNGVVIITTKRGKAGKTNINIGYQFGVSEPSRLIDWMNAAEYREIYTEATLRWQGIDPITATDADRLAAQQLLDTGFGLIDGFSTDFDTDTDWQDQAFNDDAGFQQLDISASGGNENTGFFAGLSYNDQTGILINNDFERISGRLNLDQKASDKLSFGLGLNFVRTELTRVSNDNAFATPLQLVALAPTQRARLDDGSPNPSTIYYNGLIEKENAQAITVGYRTLGNLNATYQIIDDLAFRTEFGIDVLDNQDDNYQGRVTQDGSPGGQAESRSVRVVNYTTSSFFTYDKTINENHNLKGVLGMSYQQSNRNLTSIQARGFPTDDLNTIASAAENTFQSSSQTAFSFLSYFGRVNYKLNDRYLIGLSGRIDGSSKFGDNNRYGFFPAVSAGWIISEESFLNGSSTFSFLKLRASYGITGNAPVANFGSLGQYAGAPYTTTAGLRPWTLSSPDLKWETTKQLDIGIDFGILNDRITGELDYYVKNTDDLLLSRPLPAISGFTSIFENIGEMKNSGIEIVLNSQNIVGDFSWSTSFNIAFNDNEVTKLNSDADIIAGRNRVRVGEPLGVFVSRQYAGVDPANGDALYYDEEGNTTNDINAAPNVVIGDPNPDFVGGLNNNFSYKGIELSAFFQFVQGNEVYNDGGRFQSNNASGFVDNQTRDQLARWRQPGDITDVPRAELVGGVGDGHSSRYLSDGSYIRLKTLTLGYNFPQEILSRAKLSSAKIYVSAQNLVTITDYEGWDPEVNFTGTNRTTTTTNIVQGTDFYTAPQARTISFGVNIGF